MSANVLITGGAGYIGSHVVEALIQNGFEKNHIWIFDNFSTGHEVFCERLGMRSQVIRGDLRDSNAIEEALLQIKPKAVLHFAAMISVGESVQKPELYLENNFGGTKNLLSAMQKAGCKNLVFSSTAAVYGNPELCPLHEKAPLRTINPYGESKLKSENDIRAAGEAWGLKSIIFRYFNACGATQSGLIGESHEPETHLIPLLLRSMKGNAEPLKLFGTDYSTRDGTCVRDYVHVVDLAGAHVLGVQALLNQASFLKANNSIALNLGTEIGSTVLEVIHAAEQVLRKKVLVESCARRAGDPPILTASYAAAKGILGWEPKASSLDAIIQSAWKWEQRKNG